MQARRLNIALAIAAGAALAAPLAEARITRIDITSVESPTFEGRTFGSVGAYEKLRGKAYGEVHPRDPQNAGAHHNLGSILYKLGRFDESTAAYRQSLELRPDCASTLLHLGYALREAGKLDEAVAAWEKCLTIEPGNVITTEELERARSQPRESNTVARSTSEGTPS